MARRPEGTLPRKLVKRAPLVGGYRMFNNPKVTHAAVLEAHRQSCLQRLGGQQGKVLLIHDTTVLDYSGLDVEGLGQVGDGHGKGLYAHNSLAVIPATRQVVGLMNQILHKREAAPENESRAQRRDRQNRESRLWRQAVATLPPLPAELAEKVALTDVSDRGSDITEYIAYEIQAGRQFIVRSQHNRKLVEEPAEGPKRQNRKTAKVPKKCQTSEHGEGEAMVQKLHDHLRGLATMGQYTLRVPEEAGGWREAQIAVAWASVKILPPRQARGEHGKEPMAVWGVIAREISPPQGTEGIEWILLTNRPVETIEQALEVVEDYACRWGEPGGTPMGPRIITRP